MGGHRGRQKADMSSRRPLIETAQGTRREAFGPQEWGLLVAIAAMWGSSFLFIEIGLEHFGPGVVAFGRVAVGALTLSLLRGSHRPVERSDLPRVALLGVVWMAAPLLLFPIGQQWIDSSLAGMLNGAVPIFAAVTAAILLRRLPASRQLIGIAVGFLGVVGVLWPATRDADATALGASLVLLAVLCYGVAVNIAVPLQQRYGALPVLLRAQLVALVLLAPAALVSLPNSEFAWSSAVAVVALGFFGTGWAFVAMTTLVGRVGATRGSVAIYFLPVVAIALGVIFRDETIVAISLVGTGLVLAGAYLTSRRE
ncbi:MAG TPA: DMT family transporter [Actinomycetota bacterium]|nr:DMT family transporter [Actinomycetota bacterium]